MKKLKIECPHCGNKLVYGWKDILNHNAIKPGYDFGVDTIRFFILPNIFCNHCYTRCQCTLLEETEKIETTVKELKQWP